jgi:hypothetical protein
MGRSTEPAAINSPTARISNVYRIRMAAGISAWQSPSYGGYNPFGYNHRLTRPKTLCQGKTGHDDNLSGRQR